MKTLYDVLGVGPDDDGDNVKRAFRKAVKTCHPDIHAYDPDAPLRFRQVVRAYVILRNPEARATYDQLLELERAHARALSRRYTVRKFVFDGIAATGLAVVIAAGYVLLTDVSSSVGPAKVVAVPWREPVDVNAMQQVAPTGTTEQDDARNILAYGAVLDTPTAPSGVASAESAPASAANGGDASGSTHDGLAASSAAGPDGPNISVVTMIDALDAPVHQAYAKAPVDHPKIDSAIEPLDQAQKRSSAVRSSAARDNVVAKSPLPRFAKSREKHEMKPRAPKPRAKPVMAKRQVADHAPLKQVSPENQERVSPEKKSTSVCLGSESCSRPLHPAFDVGY
jgi:hypothetical protein